MSTAVKDSMTDNSVKDGTNDAINGSEVDTNPNLLADILDGTVTTDIGGAAAIDILSARILDLDNATGAVQTNLTLEWDPGDGNQMTDNSSGVGINFKMPDDGDNQDIFASLDVMCVSDAAGAEEGEFSFKGIDGGSATEWMTLSGAGMTLGYPGQFNSTVTVGVDDTGYDVKFFGATSGKFALWDQSENTLQLVDNTNLTFGTGADADIYYDGTDLIVDPRTVGSGVARILNAAEVRGDAGAYGKLRITTGELTVVDTDKLGQIDFLAPLESSGTDAILAGASIWAEGKDTFATDNNTTDLIFATGSTAAAAEKMRIDSTGNITKATNCAFSCLSAAVTNVTGDGTGYTMIYATEIFDKGADFATSTFTAPVTGVYMLGAILNISGIAAGMTDGRLTIVTGNRSYEVLIDDVTKDDVGGYMRQTFTVLADMDAADTATLLLDITGGSRVVDIDGGNGFYGTLMQ